MWSPRLEKKLVRGFTPSLLAWSSLNLYYAHRSFQKVTTSGYLNKEVGYGVYFHTCDILPTTTSIVYTVGPTLEFSMERQGRFLGT